MTRRDFISGGSRIFLLILLLFTAGFLIGKRRVSLNGTCRDNAGCAACRLNSLCPDVQQQTNLEDGKKRI